MASFKTFCSLTVLILLFYACQQEPIETPPPVNYPIVCTDVGQAIVTISNPFELVLDSALNASILFTMINLGGGNVAFRAIPSNCEILDNSTYGYADALKYGAQISANDKWRSSFALLGTDVGNGGQFEGRGSRYLGVRIPQADSSLLYGYVLLNCLPENTKLIVYKYAVSQEPNGALWAGQIEPGTDPTPDTPVVSFGPDDIIGDYRITTDSSNSYCTVKVTASTTSGYDFEVQFFTFMWPYPKIKGKIVNGKLLIPSAGWDGNIPSPGGTPRLYHQQISGTGIFYQSQVTGPYIEWDIDFDHTGFMATSYHNIYTMYKCQ